MHLWQKMEAKRCEKNHFLADIFLPETDGPQVNACGQAVLAPL
jgi:hypothetical protein